MTNGRTMKKLKLLAFSALLFIGVNNQSKGSPSNTTALVCEMPAQNYVFQIEGQQVRFMLPIYENGKIQRRFPASVSTSTRSNNKPGTLEIVSYFENKRFKFSLMVKNKNFQDSTVSIRTRDGHEMICPLNCRPL